MSWLVFGDPPHPAPVATQVASLLGILGQEVRGKLSFPLPDVWLALHDAESARAKVAELAAAGARAVCVPAEDLAHIPSASSVKEFGLSDESFTWGDEILPWKSVRSALVYRVEPDPDPRDKARGARGREAEEQMQRMAQNARSAMPNSAGMAIASALGDTSPLHVNSDEPKVILELFGDGSRGPCRARIVQKEVAYKGLGPLKQSVILQNWTTLLRIVTERVPAGTVDRRGEKSKLRPILLNGIGLPKLLEATPDVAQALAIPADVFGRFVAWQRSGH